MRVDRELGELYMCLNLSQGAVHVPEFKSGSRVHAYACSVYIQLYINCIYIYTVCIYIYIYKSCRVHAYPCSVYIQLCTHMQVHVEEPAAVNLLCRYHISAAAAYNNTHTVHIYT
jgi:hypothetical protein